MVELTDSQILLIEDTEKYLATSNSCNLIKDLETMDKEQVNEVIVNIIIMYEDNKGDLEKAAEYEEEMKKVCNEHYVGSNPEQVDELLRTSQERYYMLERELEEKENEISNLESEIYNNSE